VIGATPSDLAIGRGRLAAREALARVWAAAAS
jgi:hypothetical protein